MLRVIEFIFLTTSRSVARIVASTNNDWLKIFNLGSPRPHISKVKSKIHLGSTTRNHLTMMLTWTSSPALELSQPVNAVQVPPIF